MGSQRPSESFAFLEGGLDAEVLGSLSCCAVGELGNACRILEVLYPEPRALWTLGYLLYLLQSSLGALTHAQTVI